MNHNIKPNTYSLTIGWLYPDLMNIYGDRGNIIVLKKRSESRGIKTEIKNLSLSSTIDELKNCDLLFEGGAQDSQQTIVSQDLKQKKKVLSQMIEDGIPGLYICGGFQFLGRYYKEADGTIIEQLGVLDMYTENPGHRRLIGNISIDASELLGKKTILVGFENHGGRTILGKGIKPLGKVLAGFGSNDEAKEEGAVYKNTIGSYLHGPILPKNPKLADFLIQKALEQKYKKEISLPLLDDTLATQARNTVLQKIQKRI